MASKRSGFGINAIAVGAQTFLKESHRGSDSAAVPGAKPPTPPHPLCLDEAGKGAHPSSVGSPNVAENTFISMLLHSWHHVHTTFCIHQHWAGNMNAALIFPGGMGARSLGTHRSAGLEGAVLKSGRVTGTHWESWQPQKP